ncbi:ABC transporter ATP-binding protein/permease [Bacillus atrophaeus]|nr:ABC transporter ATP-binding protein [Bacillus atrophaeus]MCY8512811.1 ABC transporter ATP-binding protein/permease [Bacillus atrophaeus]MCY8992603.1 ABC transporter ATP-binding protein/permease [Bacillus atrophaeus]MCY9111295.1 ABC transporter ATP-binding protein/permease [Bacillus atrophaeus]
MWQYTNPPKVKLIIGIILSLLNTSCSLIIPLLLKEQVELLSNSFSVALLIPLVILIILEFITMSISVFLLASVGQKVVKNLRIKLWDKLLKLKVEFYNHNEVGEIVSRLTNDTSVTMNLLSSEIAQLISGILSVVGSIIILCILDLPMTLVLLSSIPVIIFIVLPISKKIYNVSYAQQEKVSKFSGLTNKILSEIRLVKAYNAENKELNRGIHHIDNLYINGLKRAKIEALLIPSLGAVISLTIVCIIGYGAYRVNKGFISSGELLAFIMYLIQIVVPVGTIGGFITNVQAASGATERISEIFNQKEELIIEPAMNCPDTVSSLVFKGLSFKYSDKMILNDISFEIQPNMTTAIVGPSGVGKSTLFYLIERFYQPTKGTILYNGIDYMDIELSSWRKLFSYVSQDSTVISGTIKENIIYGLEEETIDDSKIKKAAIMANCHDFISDFSDGYDTEVGERGIKLSGGQKQRIAIARAFLRDTPFLLLDEATANLDSKSESAIKDAIESLSKGRTTIVIAHRLSTIRNADKIIVLENGNVTGMGNHNDLIKESKMYKTLTNIQSN